MRLMCCKPDLSYVSQRIICDAVDKACGILSVPITKQLRASVSAARKRYNAHIKAQKQEKLDEARHSKRRLVNHEIDNTKKRKRELEAVIADLTVSGKSRSIK
ncbi:hypothetical protein HPB49_020554 [Dermacentor silvarum]|uniref:Uncharacterized protein n=1 Tax=Dermacentor silvarum TaxID=543639 RepID=A0ACB8CZR2_DERSI|nr:hypothetical protein HPB49_020554 [Dermacentor silvarum]